MELHPIKELEFRLAKGECAFPRFAAMLRDVAEKSIRLQDGVLLLGHSPHIAPESYCYSLYPPLPEVDIRRGLRKLEPFPELLVSLLQMMNGASLFWGDIDIWGIHAGQNVFCQPAYDIRNETARQSRSGLLAVASNGGGDTAWMDCRSFGIRIEPLDKGLAVSSFASIDEWLSFEKGIADETHLF